MESGFTNVRLGYCIKTSNKAFRQVFKFWRKALYFYARQVKHKNRQLHDNKDTAQINKSIIMHATKRLTQYEIASIINSRTSNTSACVYKSFKVLSYTPIL